MADLALPNNMAKFFPLQQMRDKQVKALDFIYRMLSRGIKDIVVSAPTGVGKSVIGTTLGFWGGQMDVRLPGKGGTYYLCTQKLLQDQLENDVAKYPPHLRSAVSLKTASEYECSRYGDCQTGLMHRPICAALKGNCCTYALQKKAYQAADVAITNYPYFFTERTYSENFTPRKMLIADECHTLENQLLKFVELTIGQAEIDRYAPALKEVPALASLREFASWLSNRFKPVLESYLDAFDDDAKDLSPARARLKKELENQIAKIDRALDGMTEDPNNWVFWQESKPTTVGPERTAIAKPLSAARYFRELVNGTADARIYMSAYPGSKDVFCRTMGLDPTRVAMLTLGSSFPKEHRPIHVIPVGSMGKRSQEVTLPSLLRCLETLMKAHPDEKGIIHCNSYALGTAIWRHFEGTPQSKRLLFPRNANERQNVYESHQESKNPGVILSPSFTEGFDFANDMARWQVIAKMPFPYLGDKQVAAKKELDPEWYAMRTVMTVIQASGRICRSETDHGTTYITDADFDILWNRYDYMFPNWWKEALNWH